MYLSYLFRDIEGEEKKTERGGLNRGEQVGGMEKVVHLKEFKD